MGDSPTLKTDTVFIDVDSENSYQAEIPVEETKPAEAKPKNDKTGMDPYIVVQQRKIRCPECQRFTAETEEKMMRHIRRVHRGENPFQCSLCDYSTYNKAVFEEHVRVHQGIKPFKCSFCDYRSVSKKNTKKHEKVHRPDNPLKCKDCNFIARHFKALAYHKASNKCLGGKNSAETKDIPPIPVQDSSWPIGAKKCSACRHFFFSTAYYEQHIVDCKLCDEKICQDTMERHVCFDVDCNKVKRPTKFQCSLCKWSGNAKARILLHLIHHPNQTVNESIVNVQILRDLGIMK